MNELRLHGISVRRRDKITLTIDNLVIQHRQFIGIIGPNGAGKSTLLKCICGLEKPCRGTIHVDGQNIHSLSSLFKKSIGYVPQRADYNPDVPFTVREVAAMGLTAIKPVFSRLKDSDLVLVDMWIDRLGLTPQRNQTFRSLSGGEQQKTLLVRAMVSNPSLLLLDEPAANLDRGWKRQLADTLDRVYRHHSVTILMVSHEYDILPPHCQRLIALHRGQIIADDSTPRILSDKTVCNIIDGDACC